MITRETDYSMRLVLALAVRHNKGIDSVSSAAVAEEMDIPYRFLRKLAKRLVSGGLIESRRGKGGGVALARKPKDISLFDVLKATGPRGAELSLCVSEPNACNRSTLCRLHREFKGIQSEVDKRLKAVSLADLA
jgi:Rrf2 family iron-sulfur cluster assembly transcriptional regulator